MWRVMRIKKISIYLTGAAPPNRPPSPTPLTRGPANEAQEAGNSTQEDLKKASRATKSSPRELRRYRRYQRGPEAKTSSFTRVDGNRRLPVGRGISTQLIGGRV